MATETVQLRLDASQAITALDGLKTAVAGVVSALAIGQFTKFADEITRVTNRLLILTPSIEQANRQFDALASIAIRTGAPLEGVNNLFFRVARSADQLGISTREAAQITESISKALSMTGQSALEANGPLLQLGQALASGRFQGDELRSILEGLQPVAQALAAEMDVPIGALKELGSQGKITADVFVRAMRRARESIDEQFGRTTLTIEQRFEGVKVAGQVLFREFDKQTGTSQRVGLAIEYLGYQIFLLSKNIGPLVEKLKLAFQVIGAIVAALGFAKLMRAVGGIVGLFDSLVLNVRKTWKAFTFLGDAFNKIPKIAAAVNAGIIPLRRALEYFIKPISILITQIGTLGSAVAAFFGIDQLIESFKKFTDKGGEAENAVAEYRKELEKLREGLPDEAGAALPVIDIQGAEKLQTRLDNLRDRIKEIAVDYATFSDELEVNNQLQIDSIGLSDDQIQLNEALLNVRTRAADAVREYASIFENLKEDEQGLKPIIIEQIQAILARAAADEVSTERSIAALQDYAQKQRDVARELELITKAEQDAFDLDKLTQSISTIGLYGDELERTQMILEVSNQLRSELLRIGEAERKLIEDKIKLGEEEFNKQLAHLETLRQRAYEFADTRLTLETKVIEATQAAQDNWQGKLKEQLTELAESVSPAKTAVDLFGSVVSGIDRALTDFVEKGKFNFKDFARSILRDMALIVARAMVMRAILGAVGMIFPGSVTGLSALMNAAPRRAGGPVSASNPYLVGEAGPELFVPRSAGQIIPNNQLAMAGGGTTVNYNISAVDASSFRSLVARDPQFLYNVTEVGRRSNPARRLS